MKKDLRSELMDIIHDEMIGSTIDNVVITNDAVYVDGVRVDHEFPFKENSQCRCQLEVNGIKKEKTVTSVGNAKTLNHIMSNLLYALTKEAARNDFEEFLENWGITYDEYLQVKEYWLSKGVKTYL